MRNDFENEAMRTLESIDAISKVELPSHLEKNFLDRLERIQNEQRKGTKWFWAAAVVLFLVNGFVAANYLSINSENSDPAITSTVNSNSPTSTFTTYYYGNSSSWYQ